MTDRPPGTPHTTPPTPGRRTPGWAASHRTPRQQTPSTPFDTADTGGPPRDDRIPPSPGGRRATTRQPDPPTPSGPSRTRRKDLVRPPPDPRHDSTRDPTRDPTRDHGDGVSRDQRDLPEGRSRRNSRETTPETRGGLTARDLTRPRALRGPRHPGRPVSGQWFIDQIETEPMTPQQHRTAIRALAALIAEWQEKNNPPPENAN